MALLTASILGTTVTAQETGYNGPITATTSNDLVAVITPASANGPIATFTLVGVSTGYVNVILEDSSGQQAVLANVYVTASPGTLTITPTQMTFRDGQEQGQVAIVNSGTQPYSVLSGNANVAKATIAGNVVLVTPTGAGTTMISVIDANDNIGRITITVQFTAAPMAEQLVGFLANASAAPPAVSYNDLQIQSSYPGFEYSPQEVGGLYTETREVSGDFWLVTNAEWNQSLLTWAFVNSSINAWALKLGADGSVTHYKCAAGSNPFAWVQIWTFDGLGNLSASIGATLTTATQIAHLLTPTWNTPGGTAMVARRVNVTDTASPAGSLLDDLQVGSVSKWSVRKDGVLVAGTVPATQIVDQGGGFPAILAGSGVAVTGTWPDQTIAASTYPNGTALFNGLTTGLKAGDANANAANPTSLGSITMPVIPPLPAGATKWLVRVRARLLGTAVSTGFYLGIGATNAVVSVADPGNSSGAFFITGGNCISSVASMQLGTGITGAFAIAEAVAAVTAGTQPVFSVLQVGTADISGSNYSGTIEYQLFSD